MKPPIDLEKQSFCNICDAIIENDPINNPAGYCKDCQALARGCVHCGGQADCVDAQTGQGECVACIVSRLRVLFQIEGEEPTEGDVMAIDTDEGGVSFRIATDNPDALKNHRSGLPESIGELWINDYEILREVKR